MSASASNPIPSNEGRGKASLLPWLLLALAALAAFAWWAYETTDPVFGRFEGDVVTKWITDDLEMELVKDFNYIDPSGKRWTAPTGSIINGASIPSMFWSVIGGPFEGRFRKASVLHDAACDVQTESWEDVHRMFYDACRCSRVGIGKAQTMYWAVYHFGPRWPTAGAGTATDEQPSRRPTSRSSPRPSVTSTRNSSRPRKSKSAPSSKSKPKWPNGTPRKPRTRPTNAYSSSFPPSARNFAQSASASCSSPKASYTSAPFLVAGRVARFQADVFAEGLRGFELAIHVPERTP